MANWAIAIGINNYSNQRHLEYAKCDAEAMRNWFEQEAGFDKVFLFTEDSSNIPTNPPISTQPTYGHLRRFLRAQFEKPLLKAGDNLWLFFAGHGRRYADKDYLMLSDSDPGDIEHTAISVDYVTERLRRCGADNVVLLLDACRDEGSRSGLGIGIQEHQGVITFYSCSANQKAWEIKDLRQGSFTSALLEGLRIQGVGNCATVERLDQYLRIRVPVINQQHRLDLQNPYAVAEPATKLHLILLPKQATLQDVATLREDALDAELEEKLELAEQLWTRVLAVSPADSKALKALKRIWGTPKPQTSSSPTPATESLGARAQLAAPSQSEPAPSVRKNFTEDSPSTVCNYLDEMGLKTGNYKDSLGNDQYTCLSPYQSLGEATLGLANNIAYYVTGTQNEAEQLKIVLNINNREQASTDHETLVKYGDILLKKAVGMSLPDAVKNNLQEGIAGRWQLIGNVDVEVIREDWLTGKGYEIKLIIRSQDTTDLSPEPNEVDLRPKKGVDYNHLHDLLAAGKWKEADQETSRVMLTAAGREKEGWIGVEDIDKIPCEDLRTIDQLWVKYSNNRFGFSVQKRIYQSLSGIRINYEQHYNPDTWTAFANCVGWRKRTGGIFGSIGWGREQWVDIKDIYTFDKVNEAPAGYLPVCGWGGSRDDGSIGRWWFHQEYFSLAQRLAECNL